MSIAETFWKFKNNFKISQNHELDLKKKKQKKPQKYPSSWSVLLFCNYPLFFKKAVVTGLIQLHDPPLILILTLFKSYVYKV